MDMGLDSLAAVEFRNRVQAAFEGVRLSSTVMFDYPTVAELTDFILSQFSPEEEATGPSLMKDTGGALVVLGLAGRYPGMGANNDTSEFWSFLCTGSDPICEVPIERFDIDGLYEEDRSAQGRVYVREGGFIPGIEDFDAAFFGISEPEARAMDTHQRLQTETAYESFHNAGFTKDVLLNMECGVFVGCCTLTGITVDRDAIGPFTNIGSTLSGMSGRISHVLGLRGPCFTIDTACSSTLVAVDSAVQASRLGRQEAACVAGTNLQLRTDLWIGFCKMTGLAGDGRCKTFDASADGFGRSEGSGSMILCLQGQEREDARALGLVRGSCVNQDGRSATITAPSGPAQQKTISKALADSVLEALEVSVLECHGTGTALGDPIEIGAQQKTYGKGREDSNKLVLAAVKSVIAHAEGAAGIAGLTKLLHMMEHQQVPPNLHLQTLNPNIDVSNFCCLMPDSMTSWTGKQVAGVSSFGFSGTNTHVNADAQQLGAAPEASKVLLTWSRSDFSYKDWMTELWFATAYEAAPTNCDDGVEVVEEWLLIGLGGLAHALKKSAPNATFANLEQLAEASQVEQLLAHSWTCIAFALIQVPEDPVLDGPSLAALLRLVQGLAKQRRPPKLLLLTAGGQVPSGLIGRGLLGAASWGFTRSLRLEVPHLPLRSVDLEAGAELAAVLPRELAAMSDWPQDEETAAGTAEIVYVQGARSTPKLQLTRVAPARQHFNTSGSHLITGGLGGLGLLIAQELTDMGVGSLFLISRRGCVSDDAKLQSMFDALQASSLELSTLSCDVADYASTGEMIEKIQQESELTGIVHAAGILDFCELAALDAQRLEGSFSAKVGGAWNLHAKSRDLSNLSLDRSWTYFKIPVGGICRSLHKLLFLIWIPTTTE